MSYANAVDLTYTRSVATTTTSWVIAPPPGTSKCRVGDINVSVTTNYVGTTSPASISVGVTNNLSVLGTVNFGTAASPAQAGTALGWANQYNKSTNSNGSSTANNPVVGLLELTGANNNALAINSNGLYNNAYEVLGPITLTFTAPVGSPAGAATVDVTLIWF
jgi:hypothetical protein